MPIVRSYGGAGEMAGKMGLHDEKRYRGKRYAPADIGKPSAAVSRAEGLCHILKSLLLHQRGDLRLGIDDVADGYVAVEGGDQIRYVF